MRATSVSRAYDLRSFRKSLSVPPDVTVAHAEPSTSSITESLVSAIGRSEPANARDKGSSASASSGGSSSRRSHCETNSSIARRVRGSLTIRSTCVS